MIYYELQCRYCKKTFQAQEGSAQYKQYKTNRTAKVSCDDCDRKIEDDARKYLFDRD